jgi:hypothetical protein
LERTVIVPPNDSGEVMLILGKAIAEIEEIKAR